MIRQLTLKNIVVFVIVINQSLVLHLHYTLIVAIAQISMKVINSMCQKIRLVEATHFLL